jgi:hypothetical protein
LGTIFASVAQNPLGLNLAFDFIYSKFDLVLARFGDKGEGTFFFPIRVLLSEVLARFADSTKIKFIRHIFESYNLFRSYERTYDQIVESIEISEKFLELNGEIALSVLGKIVPEKEEL